MITLNQLLEKCNEYQIQKNKLMINFSKAFDSLEHQWIIKALVNGYEFYAKIYKQIYC